jgi:hypothetical protein
MRCDRMIAKIALVASLVALAVGGYSIASARSSSSDHHRCGSAGGGLVTCLPSDAPINYTKRGCWPAAKGDGVMYWQCKH